MGAERADRGGGVSEKISVGDLVVISRPTTHGCSGGLGLVFLATKVRPRRSEMVSCSWCGWEGKTTSGPIVAEGHMDNGKGVGLYRLKRIPPLSEMEGQRSEEQLLFPEPI